MLKSLLLAFLPLLSVANTLIIDGDLEEKSILQYSEFLELDKESTLADAQTSLIWSKADSWPKFNRDKCIWLRLQILNNRKSNKLYLNIWGIEKASIFLNGNATPIINGKHVPYTDRDLPIDPNYASIQIPSNEKQYVYIKVESGYAPFFFSSLPYSNEFAISLNSPEHHLIKKARKYKEEENGILIHHLTLGGVLLIMLFGYGLYLELGDRHYLHFTRYLLFTVIYGFFSNANGDFVKQLFDYFPLLKQYHSIPIFWFGFLMYYSFINELTGFSKGNPKFHTFFYRTTVVFSVIFACATVYLLLTNDRGLYTYLDRVTNGLLLVMVLLLTWVVFRRIKNEWASYVKVALCTLFFFGLGAYLKYDIFPADMPFALNRILTAQTGVFLDTCIFTFAIAKRIKKDQRDKIETQKKYFETEKQAIQAKLNPHFLFNSLSAGRSLVLEKNYAQASKYLLSLSQFLRGSLNTNDATFYSLSEEINLSKQYLQIENQRMNETLQFSFHLPDHELDEIPFPPLLLQPLLENCLWNGKGSTIIEVHVVLNSQVEITIKDNSGGISKQKLEELLQQKNKHFGLRLFQNKIDLFNARNEIQIEWDTHLNDMEGTNFIIKLTDSIQFESGND